VYAFRLLVLATFQQKRCWRLLFAEAAKQSPAAVRTLVDGKSRDVRFVFLVSVRFQSNVISHEEGGGGWRAVFDEFSNAWRDDHCTVIIMIFRMRFVLFTFRFQRCLKLTVANVPTLENRTRTQQVRRTGFGGNVSRTFESYCTRVRCIARDACSR